MKFTSEERRRLAVDEGIRQERLDREQAEQKQRETARRHEKKPPKTTTLPARYERGFLARLDGRTEIARELRVAFDEIVSDQGGIEGLSHVRRSLVERFCWLEAVLRSLELRIAEADKSETADLLAKWIQALNSLVGLGRCVGLERRAKKLDDLRTYVASKSRRGSGHEHHRSRS